jgi:hypothetical protein
MVLCVGGEDDTIGVYGAYTIFQNFEVTNSDTDRPAGTRFCFLIIGNESL